MYDIVYADPPWRFKTWSDKGKDRSPERHYPVMDLAAIKALPIQQLASNDCVLFLWAISTMLPQAFEVIAAWGFTYKTVGFAYLKRCRKSHHKLFTGMGYWSRQNIELCLLATRGNPKRESKSVHQVIDIPILPHSKKPTETRDRIVALIGDRPRIELFAREKVPGWDALGNEITGNDIRDDAARLIASRLPGT